MSGGLLLTVAITLANGGNYVLSITLGRWLGPERFADANLMVTLMLLVTAAAVGLQLVMARIAGAHVAEGTPDASAAVAALLARRATLGGAAVGGLLCLASLPLAEVLNVADPWNFVVLGIGMPAYLVQAVDRGLLQGRLEFVPLAATFVVEMAVRVGLAIGLVALGFGVIGATLGLTASFVATWALARRFSGRDRTVAPIVSATQLGEISVVAAPAAVLLLGQIVVNNGDVLIAKWALDSTAAGTYAAVALFGRAVFFVSWSVVTTLFPASAQRSAAGESSSRLLAAGIGVVVGVTMALVGVAAVAGDEGLVRLLGGEYGGLGRLLVGYGLATGAFAVANLIATQQLAEGRTLPSWLIVAGGVVQTGLLVIWRDSAGSLVRAQLVAMGLLVAATFGSLASGGRRLRQVAPDSADAEGALVPLRSSPAIPGEEAA